MISSIPSVTSRHDSVLIESLQDISGDCDEILYLLSDVLTKLSAFKKDCIKLRRNLFPDSFTSILNQIGYHTELYTQNRNTILSLQNTLSHSSPSVELIFSAVMTISEVRDFLRTHQGQIGALLVSTDWQSPSYAHTIRSQAGRQINTIYATVNDYKRDRHADAAHFEREFIKEYIDNWIKFPVYAYAASSGMAAFTTILNFLLLEGKAKGKVLIGNSIWFQNKGLITSAFGNQIISVDESDTAAIIRIIKNEQPSVIVFDSLANAANVTVPNLSEIIPAVVRDAKTETYLVIDNTCLACTFQPLKYVFGKRSKVRLIVFESLNKYHQFGMDRVTGGIIWCYGNGTMQLSDYRAHLGTNIPDSAVAALPTPNRKQLHNRLMRHARNVHIITNQLQSWIDEHPKSPVTSIIYPALTGHISHRWSKDMKFVGSFFTLGFKEMYQSVPFYNRFLSEVTKIARKRKINIIGGTSFGLDITRIYLTSLKSTPSTPFVRVAVGTESRMQLDLIISVFLEVFSNLN